MNMMTCRSCLSESSDISEYISVYKDININNITQIKISKMLRECTSVDCQENDGMPNLLCNFCKISIENAYLFREKCLASQELLRLKNLNLKNGDDINKSVKIENDLADINSGDQNINDKIELIILDEEMFDRGMDDDHMSESDHGLRDVTVHSEHHSTIRNSVSEDLPIQQLMVEINKKKNQTESSSNRNINAIVYATSSNNKIENEWRCDVCDKFYKTFDSLRKHGFRIHKVRVRRKIKTPIIDLITKKTIPREKTQYLCDFCGYKTERKAYLEIHQRRHTNERPFKCDTCGKSFSSKAVLTDHIMHHSTLEKVFCDVCHKGFKRQSYLKWHKQIHTDYRPFKCTFCGKRFLKKIPCELHMRTHLGETPYHEYEKYRKPRDRRNQKNKSKPLLTKPIANNIPMEIDSLIFEK